MCRENFGRSSDSIRISRRRYIPRWRHCIWSWREEKTCPRSAGTIAISESTSFINLRRISLTTSQTCCPWMETVGGRLLVRYYWLSHSCSHDAAQLPRLVHGSRNRLPQMHLLRPPTIHLLPLPKRHLLSFSKMRRLPLSPKNDRSGCSLGPGLWPQPQPRPQSQSRPHPRRVSPEM
jgi:hypothetical protein